MNDSKVSVGIKKVQLHLQSSYNRIFIKGGKIVNDDRMFEADLYIEDGLIKQLGTNLMVPGGVKTVDAKGKLIFPGGVDPNTHFHSALYGTRSTDDFYSGTKAALAGGTTTIIDCVFAKPSQSLVDAYTQYRELGDTQSCCDYALRVLVPRWTPSIGEEMATLVKTHGINTFLGCMAMGDRGVMLDDDALFDMMKKCKEIGAVAQVHAESGRIIDKKAGELFSKGITGPEGVLYSRTEETEVEATNRAILLANQAHCPLYLVNQTSPKAVECATEARSKRGAIVVSETTAAALGCAGSHGDNHLLDPDWRKAAGHVTYPPCRGPVAADRLLSVLGSGAVDCVASQHCVFRAEQKAIGKDDFRRIPAGANGVEERMSVLWEKGVRGGHIDPCRFVAVTSTNAAKLFNLYPQKGRIEAGSDADVIIWNPEAPGRTLTARNSHNKQAGVEFSVFEGVRCGAGAIEMLVAGGRVVIEPEQDMRVSQGSGRFLSLTANPLHLYGRVAAREKMCAVTPVSRQPYTGPVVNLTEEEAQRNQAVAAPLSPSAASTAPDGEGETNGRPSTRPPTRSGGRNMQESSFSFSGAQIDDNRPARSGIRTHQPPGGSSGPLW